MNCALSLVSIIVISRWPGSDEDRLGACECLHFSVLDKYLQGFHDFLVLYATQSAAGIC